MALRLLFPLVADQRDGAPRPAVLRLSRLQGALAKAEDDRQSAEVLAETPSQHGILDLGSWKQR